MNVKEQDMNIAVTATRNRITIAQAEGFSDLILRLQPTTFLHGACVGGDTDAVRLVHKLRGQGLLHLEIVAHPGIYASGKANDDRSQEAITLSDSIEPEESMFARNRRMVSQCDLLISLPGFPFSVFRELEEGPRAARSTSGGTAYTTFYALERRKQVHILFPDGQQYFAEEERGG